MHLKVVNGSMDCANSAYETCVHELVFRINGCGKDSSYKRGIVETQVPRSPTGSTTPRSIPATDSSQGISSSGESDVDSDWSGEASDLSDEEDEAIEELDRRIPRRFSWGDSPHLATLAVQSYTTSQLQRHLEQNDLDADALHEIFHGGIPPASSEARSVFVSSLDQNCQYFVLSLLGRMVGCVQAHPGCADLRTMTLVRRLSLHPDFHSSWGVFSGQVLLERLLFELHQHVLASKAPTIGLLVPRQPTPGEFDALCIEILQRQGYRDFHRDPRRSPTPEANYFMLMVHHCDLEALHALRQPLRQYVAGLHGLPAAAASPRSPPLTPRPGARKVSIADAAVCIPPSPGWAETADGE
eukprot:EG_transcript_6504